MKKLVTILSLLLTSFSAFAEIDCIALEAQDKARSELKKTYPEAKMFTTSFMGQGPWKTGYVADKYVAQFIVIHRDDIAMMGEVEVRVNDDLSCGKVVQSSSTARPL